MIPKSGSPPAQAGAGYPERFAQWALGHNSKAVHRAYAKNAQVTLLPLEEYEQKIVQLSKVAWQEPVMAAKMIQTVNA